MDQQEAADRSDPDPHDEISKMTKDLKTEKATNQFEKNYPKNIFIPIIEYLADLGFRDEYERCVGTREEFEGKNVVSLTLIFQLLTENWFQRNVNKRLLEANISNKILMNSKIKKKLFHIKVAKVLLNSDTVDPKIYKKNVSRSANKIAAEIEEDDELFDHPSSVIYLLNLFLNTLKVFFKQSSDNQAANEESDHSSSMSRQVNSKEEFKWLTKSTIKLFNRVKMSKESLDSMEGKISNMIESRAKEINEKYKLNDNVPYWDDFCTCVVARCFHCKMENQKITNSIFNQWISDFKQKSGHIGQELENTHLMQPELKFFTPTILVLPPRE